MSSAVPAGAETASLAAVEAEARAGALAMASEPESAPAPTESAPPAAPPQDPGTSPAPPAAPVSAAPAPAAPNFDLSSLDPEARAFLERKGDINKALADALRNDSRLAALARGEADPLGQVKLAPVATPPPTPAAPPQDPGPDAVKALEQQLLHYQQSDPECVRIVQSWNQNNVRLTAIETELSAAREAMNRAQLESSLDVVKADAYALQDAQRRFNESRAETLRLMQEQDLLSGRNERLDATFKSRSDARWNDILGAHQRQADAQRIEYERNTRIETAANALEAGWTPAVTRAMETHKIPADELADFSKAAIAAAYRDLEHGLEIEDAAGYLDKFGAEYAALRDRIHRSISRDYAQKKAELSAAAGSGTVVAATPTQETEAPKSLHELQQQTRRSLLAELRGR